MKSFNLYNGKAPFLLQIVGGLMYLNGLFLILGGLKSIIGIGALLIIFGALKIYFGKGIFEMENKAYGGTIVLQVLSVLFSAYLYWNDPVSFNNLIIPLVEFFIVISTLYYYRNRFQ